MRAVFYKWKAPSKSVRRYLPDSYFLLPGSKKFPYKEWQGRAKGAINCNALRVAIPRAKAYGHTTAYRKALSLYHRYCSKKR